MGFELVEADRIRDHAQIAEVVRSVPTSLHYEADDCPDKLHSCKAIGMLAVEAGVRIRFEQMLYYSH